MVIVINPEKGHVIIAAATVFLSEGEIRLLQQMVRRRNRVIHDYYDREIEVKTVIKISITYGRDLVQVVRKLEEYFNKIGM